MVFPSGESNGDSCQPTQARIPYLRVPNGEAAIRFYDDAVGGIERFRVPMPDGWIGFAELEIRGASLQLADADYAKHTPLGGRVPIWLHHRVEDGDATFEAAITAGATAVAMPADDAHAGRRATFIAHSAISGQSRLASR